VGPLPSLLSFGCRRHDADFLYGSDWCRLLNAVTQLWDRSDVSIEQIQDQVRSLFCESSASADYVPPDMLSWPKSPLLNVWVAFSQDQGRKYYVTDSLRENSDAVWDIVSSNGVVIVSGSAKSMPKDVRSTLKAIIIERCISAGRLAGEAATEADRILAQMDREKRYIVEAWS
jgi:sulfite reductase alpha subunit-like flavoprotein